MTHAAVVGAGIGGLTVALALARHGMSVTVFERASKLHPVGAGIQLSPNALDVLDRLGVAAHLRGAVAAHEVTLRGGRSGRVLARVPVASEDGRGYVSLLRSDLQSALVERVEGERRIALHLGREFATLHRDGDVFRLDFADGQDAGPFDVVVAADGVHSVIGRQLGRPEPRDSGVTALRLRVARDAAPGIEAWLGPRRHAVSYPIADGRETNLVLVVPHVDVGKPPRDLFRAWDPRLQMLIEAGTPLGSWPLLSVAPFWRANGVALIGDAAHAMLPFAAQGAAMAIEDGWVLALCLAEAASRAEALDRYAALRAPRLRRVLGRVAFHRVVYHLPPPASLARDAVLRLTPRERLRAGLAWLYDWRAPTDVQTGV